MSPRIEALAQPIRRQQINKTYNESYTVKKSALSYVASERLIKLAQPKKTPTETINRPNFQNISRNKPLKSTESKTKSQPISGPLNKKTNDEKYTVKKYALNYVTSERLIKLAQPKKAPTETINRPNFQKISQNKSTKYETSDRIKKLSEPKVAPISKIFKDKEDQFKVNPSNSKMFEQNKNAG